MMRRKRREPRISVKAWVTGICVGMCGLIVAMLVFSPVIPVLYLSFLRRGNAEAVPYAIEQLQSKSLSIRSAAARGLGQIGPDAQPAVPLLLAHLRSDSWQVASSAAWALSGIGDTSPEVIETLIEGLEHEHREVRRYSAYALSELSYVRLLATRPAIPALIPLLDDPHVCSSAARALGSLRARECIPELTALLDTDSRVSAMGALVKLQPLPEETISAIEALLNDDDEFVRECAERSVKQINR